MMNGLLSAVAAALAFTAASVLGYVVIPYLRKLKFGQTILDIGPKWHKSKQGTPTMGGVIMIFATLISLLLTFLLANFLGGQVLFEEMKLRMRFTSLAAGLLLALGMALIGFADDYIKVVKKRNLGLTARQKTLFQLVLAAVYLLAMAASGMNRTWLPFLGDVDITRGAGLLFWPVALLFIYGFTNAVNLTDGVDGLAGAVTLVVAGQFMLAASFSSLYGMNILAAVLAGSCVGFLIWNLHPAKVFMGDTGSMFLGGMVIALAFGTGKPILLLLSGCVYLMEALSVVIQVTYYKRTKKRIFKMSPIHHHFEMSGWSEEKIVLIFSLISVIGGALALLPFYLELVM